MKRILYVIFVLLLSNHCLLAQQKIEGTYNAGPRTFNPKNQHILVKYFRNDNLAPFMIKGNNPFAADSNHVGFIDTTGRIVIKPDYNNCSYFEGKYALVLIAGKTYRDYKWGVINKKGKMVIPPGYERLGKCPNGLFEAIKGNKMGFINIHNKIIVPFGKYSAYATPPPIYTEEGDVGHMDFYWDELYFGERVFFRNYIGVKSGKKWAVIDSTGKEVVPPKFDGIGIFNHNIAPAKIGEKYGVTDSLGNMVIPALYDLVELSGKNYLYVYKGKKAGVLTLSNRLILPMEFSSILPFGDGFTAYDGDGKAILFDADGTQIGTVHSPVCKFPFWRQKGEGFFVYNSNNKKYHSYQNFEDIINEYRGSFRQIFYNRNNAWGLMDASGREITPPLFDGFNRYKLDGTGITNKYIAVVKDNKWGGNRYRR